MRALRGDKRFWESTRGRIILLLRRGSRTVNDLSAALELTDNAVRTHLTALERDGLVHTVGTRPGTRKPNIAYALTPESEQLFPKIYGPVLRHVLDVFAERTSPKKLEEMLQAVGHRLAAKYVSAVETEELLQDRIDRAVTALEDLGGLAERMEFDGKLVIRCFVCPLATVVEGHPEACRLLETALADIVGVPVEQHCAKDPKPRCQFEMAATGS